MKTIKSKSTFKSRISKVTTTFSLLLFSAISVADASKKDLGTSADSLSATFYSITTLILAGAAMIGVIMMVTGFIGFNQSKQGGGEGAGTHTKRIVIGACLFAITGIGALITNSMGVEQDEQATSIFKKPS